MYTFEDKLNGESLTLRPEATAGIVRAAIEHNLAYERPLRVWTGGAMFRHGPTYSAHPTCCAAAMANLDIIRRESLLQRGMELEGEIAAALRGLEGRELVAEIRAGIGALGAVAFDADALAAHPDLPARVFAQARARGVFVRPLGDGVALSPPLVVTAEEVEHAAEVIGEALAAVARDRPAAAAAG